MKNKRKYRYLMSFMLLLMLLCLHSQVASAASKPPANGWYTAADGNKYYYKNSKMLKGWQKISGYWYRFNGKGIMNANCIVPSKDGAGYRFMGPDGIYVKDSTVQRAVNIVMAHTTATKTKRERLKQGYDHLKKTSKYKSAHYNFSGSIIPSLAYQYLGTRKGECISTSCGFAYISLVLGFNTRITYLSWHTWPEVASGTTWYVYDLSREFNSYFNQPTWFKVGLKSNATYKYGGTHYVPVIKKGVVTWVKQK